LAAPPFESHIREEADAGGVRIDAVREHGDIDYVCGHRIFPDFGIDSFEIDLRTPRLGEEPPTRGNN
jgi:hypothetical protein